MACSFLISRRTVLSRENRLLVNLTTWIAVVGVALGMAALVVVNAVYDGYVTEIRNRIIDVQAHIQITSPTFRPQPIRGDEDFLAFVESQPGVLAAAPVITRQGLLVPRGRWNSRRAGAAILGIDVERTRRVTQLLDAVTEGVAEPGVDEIVLGGALAERLLLGLGDTVTVLADLDSSGDRPTMRRGQFHIVGLFESGFYQVDQSLAYVSAAAARELFGLTPSSVDQIHLRLEDPWRAGEIAAAMRPELPSLVIQTWRDQRRGFFEAIEMTRVILLLIIFLLVAVASSNVIGTLIMLVHDRTRAIGILRAMGATRASLATVFVLIGLFIGALGISVGVGIALLLCAALTRWNLIPVPESVYFIDHLPVLINWPMIGGFALATVAVCLVASVAPALRAARLDPVEALRHE